VLVPRLAGGLVTMAALRAEFPGAACPAGADGRAGRASAISCRQRCRFGAEGPQSARGEHPSGSACDRETP
jgi:hypothetical protein